METVPLHVIRTAYNRESLSDTILCLKANAGMMYHLGIGEVVAKSTLSKANENRSYRIYEDLAMRHIQGAKVKIIESIKLID